jgi:hypothetical protein
MNLEALDTQGWTAIGGLLAPAECPALVAMYDDDSRFRAKVTMARHGFGRGAYKYFAHPCRRASRNCARRCIPSSCPSPIAGTRC